MKFMLIAKNSSKADAGPPDPRLMAALGKLTGDMVSEVRQIFG